VGIGVARAHVQPWVDTLRAELLLRDGERAEGARILDRVAGELRAALGPDAWIQALFRLEALSRLARDVGEWELAAVLARQMLEHDPAYGGSHLAAALVAEHRGDRAAAARSFAAAERCWAEADDDLPELEMARERKASLGRAGAP
jgi:hypothetical protein